jgi:purine-binding chemotaxis protein CheW
VPADPSSDSVSSEAESQFVVLRVARRDVAVAVSDVVEMIRLVSIVPLPNAPTWVAGVVNLRGTVIPVVDLRRRLSVDAAEWTLDTPICVVDVDGRMVGLIADDALEVITVEASSVATPQGLTGVDHPVKAVLRAEAGLVPVLAIDRVCDGTQELVLPELEDHAA